MIAAWYKAYIQQISEEEKKVSCKHLPKACFAGKIGGDIWLIFGMAGSPKYCTAEYQPNIDLDRPRRD